MPPMTCLPMHRNKDVVKENAQTVCKAWLVPIYVVFAPWYVALDLITVLLREQSDQGFIDWADRKLEEYTFVEAMCSLLAGVVGSALTWQDLGSLHWATKGLWYGTLLITVVTICLAMHQSSVLKSLHCYDDCGQRIRRMLRAGQDPTRARKSQLFVWQAPIMLSNFGVVFFIVGLVISVVTDFDKDSWTLENIMASVIFAVIGTGAGITCLFNSLALNYETLPESLKGKY